MKKNKTAAYMLAATLLVGGTFVGTKALFTDSVDSIGELTLSTGDIDIEAEVIQDWILDRNGKDDNKGTNNPGAPEGPLFDNLKTGDVLTKTVEIENVGTLIAEVILMEEKSVTAELPEGINLTAYIKDESGNLVPGKSTMLPGKKATIDFKIEVAGGGEHNKDGSLNSDEQEQVFIDLDNAYTLNAVQQNPDGLGNTLKK